MTSEDIRIALRNKYSDHQRFAIAEEVGLTTGYSHRRLDMMVLDCFSSNGFRIDGIEIKISTSDLKHELIDPEKHVAFFDVIDYYTIACPKGVIDPIVDIIPKTWGILIIDENGSSRYKRRPLALHDSKLDRTVPRGFLASVVRNIQGRQPSEIELQKKYDEGYKAGEKSIKSSWEYQKNRVQQDYDKIQKYEELCYRFRLWDDKNVERAMDEFEKFRKADLSFLSTRINNLIDNLNKLNESIDIISNNSDSEEK